MGLKRAFLLNSLLPAILSIGISAPAFASGLKFQWDPNSESDLAGYRLHYGVSGEEATEHMDVGLLTTAAISTLDPDKSYDFVVTAYNTSGMEGSSSNIVTVPESVPPAVSIVNPLTNAAVSDTVLIQATASDNVGVVKVEFYLNDILTTTATSDPYRYYWDTRALTSGAYNITAKAFDAAGNAAVSKVAITVVNDVIPPEVSRTFPAQENPLSGEVTVSCSASDNVAVAMVEFYVNGVMAAAVNTKPYSYELDTATVANGSYILTSKAYDVAGNVGRGGDFQVTVFNDAPSAPLNISHALQALKIAVGILPPTDAQTIQLDVAPYTNGESLPDGKIDIRDALAILSISIGKIPVESDSKAITPRFPIEKGKL